MDDKPHTWRDMLLFWATIILGLTAILLIQEHTVSLAACRRERRCGLRDRVPLCG